MNRFPQHVDPSKNFEYPLVPMLNHPLVKTDISGYLSVEGHSAYPTRVLVKKSTCSYIMILTLYASPQCHNSIPVAPFTNMV